MSLTNKCRHFNGSMHKCCAAGVEYDTISRTATEGRFGCALRLPCWHDTEAQYPCPSLSRLSDAEIAEQEAKTNRRLDIFLERLPTARAAILLEVGEAREYDFVKGEIPCPICKTGCLRFLFNGHVNGHIQARCNTPDCVEWCE